MRLARSAFAGADVAVRPLAVTAPLRMELEISEGVKLYLNPAVFGLAIPGRVGPSSLPSTIGQQGFDSGIPRVDE